MNLKEPIEIDFIEFFKSGKFDCLRLGQTKEWILNNFPEPDSRFDKEWLKKGFDIWTYGDIELHFSGEVLFLIFSDYWGEDIIEGGEKLKLTNWFFVELIKSNFLAFLKDMNNHKIGYKTKIDELGVSIRLNSGIELTFENPDEDNQNVSANDFMVTSFGLVEENTNRWK